MITALHIEVLILIKIRVIIIIIICRLVLAQSAKRLQRQIACAARKPISARSAA